MVPSTFYSMQDEMPLGTSLSLEVAADEDYHVYQTLFVDHAKGMGVLVNPRSMIQMRIEKEGVTWASLRFELKT